MKYVVISQTGNLYVVEKSEEVDQILRQNEGIFFLIQIYPAYSLIEKYQVENGKIYRVNNVKI